MYPEEATTSASGNHHQVQLQLEISEVVWEVIFLTIWIWTNTDASVYHKHGKINLSVAQVMFLPRK